MLVFAPLGAVPVVGGSSDPSVPRFPGVSPQKEQGGPWAPPPCSVKSSATCWVCIWFYVRFLWDGCWVFFVVFFVCLWGWNPSGPDPCLPSCLLSSLSLSVYLVGSPTTLLCLFSSLRRWGNPSPCGLGFPLCFFVPAVLAHLDPFTTLRTYFQVVPNPCFFCRRLSVFFCGGWLVSVCLGCVGFLSPFCFCMQEYNAQSCFW